MFVIVGLGKTGLSCVRFLTKQNQSITVMDQAKAPKGLATLKKDYPQVDIQLGEFDPEILLKATTVIVSPGIPLTHPAFDACRANNIPVIGDLELFAQHVDAPVIAITGSNGKTTVTTLMGEILRQAGLTVKVAGNIGVPALDCLSSTSPDYYVLELSSFQLEATHSLKPRVAALLNVTPDHMDRYENAQAYQQAKQRVYQHSEMQVYNRQDRLTYPEDLTHAISFGSDPASDQAFGLRQTSEGRFLMYGDDNLLCLDELRLKGSHNALNALACLAMGHAIGLSLDSMLAAIKTFPGLPHRCQWVKTIRKIPWYNDSKGTNVGATIAAIQGLGAAIAGRIVLIAGGQGKGADFASLADVVSSYVKTLILFGEDAEAMATALRDSTTTHIANDLPQAVQLAGQAAEGGDLVLFSPACASFDMFDNFEHRGDVFIDLVNQQGANDG